MSIDFVHTTVLLKESVDMLVQDIDGTYVDCTMGGAGHSCAIAERLSEKGRLICIDQDKDAILAGHERLRNFKCQIDIVKSNFSNIDQILIDLGIEKVNGFLFDLGVSSHQLDIAERGFSYMNDAPLDMRMNREGSLSAYEVVNDYSEKELTDLIYEYGEERWAKRIVKFIIERRQTAPITTTGELVDIIKAAIPANARRDGPHPAKRTFQAIRIEVNNELGILAETFKNAAYKLKSNGRICVITFHSLEDRITKKTFQDLAKSCICPPKLPVCMCNVTPVLKAIKKPIAPSDYEVEKNPRSRSAKLRVAEKL